VNAQWFGAGLGSGNDSERIANALSTLAAAGGGELFFPKGIYVPTTSIVVGSNTILRGESMASQIQPAAGSFDTIAILGSKNAGVGNIEIDTLYFAEASKTAGNSIYAQYVWQLAIHDCQFDSPAAGFISTLSTRSTCRRSGSPECALTTLMVSG
jgi:hypothetical protein